MREYTFWIPKDRVLTPEVRIYNSILERIETYYTSTSTNRIHFCYVNDTENFTEATEIDCILWQDYIQTLIDHIFYHKPSLRYPNTF